jgi:hypothetical protein
MHQGSFLAVLGISILISTLFAPVLADQTFHSQRLDLARTDAGALNGHPVLRSGQVVDIHADGPQIGALERYMVNGAKANTSYDVILHLFNNDCDGAPAGLITTATLETNAQGNAQGQWLFTAEDLSPFAGLVFGIQWTLVSGGVIAYQTPCIVVAID